MFFVECQIYVYGSRSASVPHNKKMIMFGRTDTKESIHAAIRREFNIDCKDETRLWVRFGDIDASSWGPVHPPRLSRSVPWDYVKERALSGINLNALTFGIQIINNGNGWKSPTVKIGKIGEIEETLKKKKMEHLDLKERLEKLDRERKSLLDKSRVTSDEIRSLEDQLTKLKQKPLEESNNLTAFLVRSIKQKEAELTCPVCLETAAAPIFMCQQQHLICSSCQPLVTSCPECRESYQGPPRRHRYAERDAEELRKLQEELAKITS